MKSQSKCLFCKGTGMTKEHFWPDWVSQHLNKSESNSFTSDYYVGHGKVPQNLVKRRQQQGSLFTKKFRVVCGKCNNGWMSRVETELKPILLPILKNEKIIIGHYEQELLAKWITLKSMVAEHSQIETRVTPDSDLKSFYGDFKIPEYYKIFIGRHTTGVHTWFARHTATFSLNKDRYNPPLNGLEKNSQAVTFLIGPLVVHILAARVAGFDLATNFLFPTLQGIWPATPKDIEWPIARITTEEALDSIVHAFDKFLKAPNIKYAGPLLKENNTPTH